ncbi:GNAT family N-acetyltransferase [Demetria terragena]|uniref:GNAT family N-acetyltransferase n=1 Tax=Demetria terragena TaxID=63959 RepID=UPI000371872E|nr:GNAT family N-acetyltransferase [Demetria terragena]
MSTNTSVLTREADGDDLVAVVDVGHRTWPVTFGPIAGDEYVAMGLAKWWTQEAIIPAIRKGRVTVAEVNGEVVGMSELGVHDDHAWMWKLYVLPEYQGCGVGGALMRAAIHRVAAQQHTQLRLSYLDGNEHAAAFYTHHGFEHLEVQEGGSGMPDNIVVSREITPTDAPVDERGEV